MSSGDLISRKDAIEAIKKLPSRGSRSGNRGVYECFHCGSASVVWQCDYDFEDFGYEGEGIVQICHCENCGADIEYRIPNGGDEE